MLEIEFEFEEHNNTKFKALNINSKLESKDKNRILELMIKTNNSFQETLSVGRQYD